MQVAIGAAVSIHPAATFCSRNPPPHSHFGASSTSRPRREIECALVSLIHAARIPWGWSQRPRRCDFFSTCTSNARAIHSQGCLPHARVARHQPPSADQRTTAHASPRQEQTSWLRLLRRIVCVRFHSCIPACTTSAYLQQRDTTTDTPRSFYPRPLPTAIAAGITTGHQHSRSPRPAPRHWQCSLAQR